MKGSYYIIQASLIEISTYNYQVYLYTYMIGISKRIHYGSYITRTYLRRHNMTYRYEETYIIITKNYELLLISITRTYVGTRKHYTNLTVIHSLKGCMCISAHVQWYLYWACKISYLYIQWSVHTQGFGCFQDWTMLLHSNWSRLRNSNWSRPLNGCNASPTKSL